MKRIFLLNIVVNFASSLLCGVNYAQLPRQVEVDIYDNYTQVS